MVGVVGDSLHGFLLMYNKERADLPVDFAFEHGNAAKMWPNCGFFADFALILKQKFNLRIGAEKCFMAMFGGSPFLTLGVLQ